MTKAVEMRVILLKGILGRILKIIGSDKFSSNSTLSAMEDKR
jgi:hypothetical protein